LHRFYDRFKLKFNVIALGRRSQMFKHFILMSVALITLSACASDEVTRDVQPVIDLKPREKMTNVPIRQIDRQDLDTKYVRMNDGGTRSDFIMNIGDRVFFGYDRYDLTVEARTLLERQAAWLVKYPDLTVMVEGHADERGTREYNLALGERRANSVKNYLVAYGVDPRRVTTISYGKERPSVAAANSSAWTKNRRAVTVVK